MDIRKIKGYGSADTPFVLADLIKAAGGTLGPKLSAFIKHGKKRLWLRNILTLVTLVGIIAGMYMAINGAEFIFTGGSYFAAAAGILSIVLLIILYSDIFTGKIRWVILALEIVSLGWNGVMIPGYFGQSGAKQIAEGRVNKLFAKAQATYFTDAMTLQSSTAKLKESAISVEEDEKLHDHGQGTVYGKAAAIAKFTIDSLPPFPTPLEDSLVPDFDGLTAINKWMGKQASELSGQMQPYVNACGGMKTQVSGFADGIDSILAKDDKNKVKLNDSQRNNLMLLAALLRGVQNHPLNTPKLESENLTASDLQVDWRHRIMGLLFEAVIASFFFIIIKIDVNDADMDDLKKESVWRSIDLILAGWGVTRVNLTILDYQAVENLVEKMETDVTLRAYVKKVGFNAAFDLEQKNPSTLDLIRRLSLDSR